MPLEELSETILCPVCDDEVEIVTSVDKVLINGEKHEGTGAAWNDDGAPEDLSARVSCKNCNTYFRITEELYDRLMVADYDLRPLDAMQRFKQFDQGQAIDEGWCVIRNSRGVRELQRDDDQEVFLHNSAAVQFVKERAAEGSAYHKEALESVRPQNPYTK